jgi:hypothetical protein
MERQNSLKKNNKKLCCSGLVERVHINKCSLSLSLFSDISFVKRGPKVEQGQDFCSSSVTFRFCVVRRFDEFLWQATRFLQF